MIRAKEALNEGKLIEAKKYYAEAWKRIPKQRDVFDFGVLLGKAVVNKMEMEEEAKHLAVQSESTPKKVKKAKKDATAGDVDPTGL